MKTNGYQTNKTKAQKITNEGRTVLYPNSGLVTFQPKGQSHTDYSKSFNKK